MCTCFSSFFSVPRGLMVPFVPLCASLPLEQRIVYIGRFLQLTVCLEVQYYCQPFWVEGLHEPLHVKVSSTTTHCHSCDTIHSRESIRDFGSELDPSPAAPTRGPGLVSLRYGAKPLVVDSWLGPPLIYMAFTSTLGSTVLPVSYTHLTLPTTAEV